MFWCKMFHPHSHLFLFLFIHSFSDWIAEPRDFHMHWFNFVPSLATFNVLILAMPAYLPQTGFCSCFLFCLPYFSSLYPYFTFFSLNIYGLVKVIKVVLENRVLSMNVSYYSAALFLIDRTPGTPTETWWTHYNSVWAIIGMEVIMVMWSVPNELFICCQISLED